MLQLGFSVLSKHSGGSVLQKHRIPISQRKSITFFFAENCRINHKMLKELAYNQAHNTITIQGCNGVYLVSPSRRNLSALGLRLDKYRGVGCAGADTKQSTLKRNSLKKSEIQGQSTGWFIQSFIAANYAKAHQTISRAYRTVYFFSVASKKKNKCSWRRSLSHCLITHWIVLFHCP
jgi:hypothetical protein